MTKIVHNREDLKSSFILIQGEAHYMEVKRILQEMGIPLYRDYGCDIYYVRVAPDLTPNYGSSDVFMDFTYDYTELLLKEGKLMTMNERKYSFLPRTGVTNFTVTFSGGTYVMRYHEEGIYKERVISDIYSSDFLQYHEDMTKIGSLGKIVALKRNISLIHVQWAQGRVRKDQKTEAITKLICEYLGSLTAEGYEKAMANSYIKSQILHCKLHSEVVYDEYRERYYPLTYKDSIEALVSNGQDYRIVINDQSRNWYLDRGFRKCYSCRRWESFENCQEIENAYVCNTCFEELDYCAECGKRILHSTYVDDEAYCEECLEANFQQCDECSEYYRRGEGERLPSGRHICGNCFTEYYTSCEYCGNTIHVDSSYCTEEGETLCESCYRGYEENCRFIHDYSYKPSFSHIIQNAGKGTRNVLFTGKERIYGFENEVECTDSEPNDQAQDVAEASGMLYCKHDSSIAKGFEIVSYPFNLEFYQKHFKKVIKLVNEHLVSGGAISHRTKTCGLHIHVNRASVSTLTQYKLMRFFGNGDNFGFLESFSRRKDFHYCKLETMSKLDCAARAMYRKTSYDRYVALNFTKNTIELRINRGTLKTDTLSASLQFYEGLISFCEQSPIPQAHSGEAFRLWLQATSPSKYRELKAYMIDRKIA